MSDSKPVSARAPAVSAPAARRSGLQRLAVTTLLVLLVAMVTGSLVASSDSGLADRSWPGFESGWWPEPARVFSDPAYFLVVSHRFAAFSSGVLCLLLAIALWRGGAESSATRRALAIGLFLALLASAGLGGVSVLWRLPPFATILHSTLAVVSFALAWTVALVTGRGWNRPRPEECLEREKPDRAVAGFGLAATIVTFLLIVLGAVPRHATAESGGSTMVLVGIVIHVLWALIALPVSLMLFLEASRNHRRRGEIFRPALSVLFLLVLQLFLGLATFITLPGSPPSTSRRAGPAEARDRSPSSMSSVLEGGTAATRATGLHELASTGHHLVGLLMLVSAWTVALRGRRLGRELDGPPAGSSSPPA